MQHVVAVDFPKVRAAARERYAIDGSWDGRLLDSYLEAAAAESPSRVAIVDGDDRLTYLQFAEHVSRVAGGLRALDLAPGDVLSFQLPNWWESLVIHFAALRLGAVSNPLMPILRERELRFMLRQARSSILIVPDTFRGHDFRSMALGLRHEIDTLAHVVIVRGLAGEGSFEALLSAPRVAAATDRTADDAALLLYTSGTESDPKGAVHTHNTLGYEDRSIIDLYDLDDADVMYMPSPVAHITGVLYGFHLATLLGAKVVLQDIWDATTGLELIEREGCSFIVAATPFLHGLVHHPDLAHRDTSSLRVFACGGADVPPVLIETAEVNLGCLAARVYGSTEFPTLSAGGPADSPERRANTDGRVIGAAEAVVVGEAGIPVPEGKVGDLRVRGPEAFLGYLDRDRTAESVTADGWFSTGDLARLDGPYVQIVGRRKDVILRGGENISSKEVEDLLFSHPEVEEVAIVAMADSVMVERACAVVVPRGGRRLILRDLMDYLIAQQVARQKLPERLELVDFLPKNPSGKVQKFKLRELVAERIGAEAAHDKEHAG